MAIQQHKKVTGFSGNEIYCLNLVNYQPGQLCLGNHVIALGVMRGLGAGLSNLAGGEVTEVTQLVHDGRMSAYNRMLEEAKVYGGIGLAGVSFDMISHGGNLEFIAIGSTIHEQHPGNPAFTTADSGQALYCQLESGFVPHQFVFGNVAYSIGVGGSIGGMFKSLVRGEVESYTKIFDHTRHLALTRIKQEAMKVGANAVIGIKTAIMPLLGTQEMMMTGTASSHPALVNYASDPVTSDLTNEELWNLVHLGYLPITLVMGVSVYSLGLVGGIGSSIKSLIGGNVDTLSDLLYEARENALSRVQRDADACGADEVVGVKTYIYDLGGGLVEFMAIGTAVKKLPGVTTRSAQLPPQAIIQDQDTFVDSSLGREATVNRRSASSASAMQTGPISIIVFILVSLYFVFSFIHG